MASKARNVVGFRTINAKWTLIVVVSTLTIVPFADAQGPPVPFGSVSLVNLWAGFNDDNLWPAVAYNTAQDEFLVVWQHWGGGAASDIYAQRMARNGQLLGSTIPVAVGLGSTLPIEAAVAFAPAHQGFLVVYPRPVTVSEFDIAGRWVNWDGTVGAAEITIADGPGSREAPDVAYNPFDDEFLVVWHNVWPGGERDVDARRLNAGNLNSISWANVATGSDRRISPHVAFDSASRQYLITYNRWGSGDQVVSKLAAANLLGVSVAPEIEIYAGPDEALGNAVAAASGEYLVAWMHIPLGSGNVEIRARRVSDTGVPQGAGTGFALELYQSAMSWLSFTGDVAFVPGYGYMVVWTTPGAGPPDVWGCSIQPGTDAPWGGPFVIDTSAYSQMNPAVAAASPEGEMFVIFQDGWSTSDVTYDLRGYLFDSGIVLFGDDFESGDPAHWEDWTR